MITMHKRIEYAQFRNLKKKKKKNHHLWFLQILKTLYKSGLNKYQKHVACSYSYKLVCADEKFTEPFELYLGKGTVYNFISIMI